MSEAAIAKAAELLCYSVEYLEYVECKMILSFNESIEGQIGNIEKAVSSLEIDYDDYAIVLPGSSMVTAGVIATLAGLSGRLPIVVVIAEVDGRFMPTEVVDLHKIKIASRLKRDKDAIKLA